VENLKKILAILLAALIFGCTQPIEQKIEFTLDYARISEENTTVRGPVFDEISFPRDSVYFHIRANITSKDNITHYLRVLDQSAGLFGARLPVYSKISLNGIDQRWVDRTGIMTGIEETVVLEPGVVKPLEQPVFFFNQNISERIPPVVKLRLEIVNASGTVLGYKEVLVTISGS
jgi:hypothetical protein